MRRYVYPTTYVAVCVVVQRSEQFFFIAEVIRDMVKIRNQLQQYFPRHFKCRRNKNVLKVVAEGTINH